MADQKPLRWGILGCARITRWGLIPGIRASTGGELIALASRDGSVAKEWASEFQVPRSFDSYEALLADPDIEAVYVPLPNELHAPWVTAAADAGKHVLCEKPLAIDAAEAKVMADHCRSRGVLLMEAAMWRHQPRSLALRKMVADGVIGDLRLIRSSFSFPMEGDDWRLDPARGGGALWDVGTYGVSTARYFSGGEPVKVRSLGRFGPTGVDMTLTAEMAFPGGVIGLIDCSFEQPFRCTYELIGTRGVIEVPDAYLPKSEPVATLRSASGADDRELTFDGFDQYAAMVDAFGEAVRSGKGLTDPAESGVAQMAVLDAILAAARDSE